MAVTWKKIAYYDTLLTVEEQEIVGRLTGGNVDGITIGIADNNMVQIDDADAADNDYCKLTANGIEGRSASEVKTDLSLNNVENTAHSTDAHTMTIDGRDVSVDGSKLDGIEASADKTDATNVDAAGAVMESDTDYVDKTHLSQDFGASGVRLCNLILTPISGKILNWSTGTPLTSGSPFSAKINGNPTSTSIVYDGDSNEGMFDKMDVYDGTNYWGKIILHNTTKSESVKIEAVNIDTNTITVEANSPDDSDTWDDEDDITVQSQTNAQAGYFDVDLSDKVASTDAGILLWVAFGDKEGNDDTARYVFFHPYESYDAGKRFWLTAYNANEQNGVQVLFPVVSQKMTVFLGSGCNGANCALSILGTMEYADT